MTNIDRAAEVIADAFRPGFGVGADAIGRDLVHLLDDAGLLMPDDATTQTETVGPYFPEGEEAPDVPDGTDVTRIVGPWEEA
jgi:hypothetical protein